MEPFSQKFEVLTQPVDVINPNMARKWMQTCIPCTNGDRKMKVKSKNNFVVRYSLMELFFQNLEILVPCCDAIVSKLCQKDSNSYITRLVWFKKKFMTEFLNFETSILVVTSLFQNWNYQGRTYI